MNMLGIGMKAVVKEINCGSAMERRLGDMGLIKGTNVSCVQRSPLGDPTAYMIRGAVIALRSDDAAKITVG